MKDMLNTIEFLVNIDTSKNDEQAKYFREQARRCVSNANKRIKRLETQDLHSNALQKLKKEGIDKFSVKGKSNREVQLMLVKLGKFWNNKSSTVSGAKSEIERIAKQVNMPITKDYKQMNNDLKKFFELTEKIEQYMMNSKNYSRVIGYQKLWEVIGEMCKQDRNALEKIENDIGKAVDYINDMIEQEYISESKSTLEKMMNGEL